MKHTSKRLLSMLLCLFMLASVVPTTVFAAVTFNHDSTTTSDAYYNVVSKKDWDIAPGISESEIVLNNDDGTRRQVAHVMVADMNNEYAKVVPSYTNMDTSNYAISNMWEQATYAEENLGWNVVGAMNTCLSWYDGAVYKTNPERVHEPLGFMMLDASVLYDGCNGFPSCLVINKDVNDSGEARPADIAKVQMRTIKSSADLTGWENQVIPCSSGFIVKDGVNQSSTPNHSGDNSNSAPRSVVGITPEGKVIIMMNDGRQSFSAGMGMYECAELMLDLGCSYAVNCDGGGSSTFISERPGEELAVNCSPSDGSLRDTTNGIFFISTAPSTGEFVRATLSTESKYYTPGSTVEFTAVGSDLVGSAAQIPADVTWQIKETGMGTIENGVFTSSGKTGTATAQMVYNNAVVGEDSVQIVVPEAISFSTSVFAVKFGTAAELSVIATTNGGMNEVVLKSGDITIASSNPAIGTISGTTFTAVDEANAPASLEATLVATLNCGTGITASATLKVCHEITAVLYDFEDSNSADAWDVWEINKDTYATRPKNYDVTSATAADGQVHDGSGSLRLFTNGLNNKVLNGSKDYFQIEMYPKQSVELANVESYGMWIFIPDEYYSGCWGLRYYSDNNGDGVYETLNKAGGLLYGYTLLESWDESGWYYLNVNVGGKNILLPGADVADYTGGKYKTVPNDCRFLELYYIPHTADARLQNNGTVNGKYTMYIDSITVDYAKNVADRTAPVFSNVSLLKDGSDAGEAMLKGTPVTSTSNVISATASVSDSGDGLNGATAKAYVDGVSVASSYTNGKISISNVTLANGIHRIKFEICDRAGNKAVVIRLVNIQSAADISTVVVEPKDATLDKLLGGSVYWMDIKATDIETIKSVTTTIDINSSNHWELDHMALAPGFTATYSVNEETNTADITITRTGDNTATGEAVLASLPIRIIYFDTDIQYPGLNAQTYWTNNQFWAQDLKVDVDMGVITYVDNGTSTFSNDEFSVDSEMYVPYPQMVNTTYYQEHGSLHVHTEVALADKAATCTEAGYTGRTYCEVCDSVVNWGTEVPATGHSYEMVDGVLMCAKCGETFTGTFTDGKDYVDGIVVGDGWHGDYYYLDGVKVANTVIAIENVYYTFDENGISAKYTGTLTANGKTYYAINGALQSGWQVIDNDTYYFSEDDFAGLDGEVAANTLIYTSRSFTYTFDNGKLVSGVWVETNAGTKYYYGSSYYVKGWHVIDGEQYFFADGYRYEGDYLIKTTVNSDPKWYHFDDNGVCTGFSEGFVTNGTYKYYVSAGEPVYAGLIQVGTDFYYIRSNGMVATGDYYVTKNNGLAESGTYKFAADGKMIEEVKEGIVHDDDGEVRFYVNGVATYAGMVQDDNGDIYYINSSKKAVKSCTYTIYEFKTNGIKAAGNYAFDAEGKMIDSATLKNGIVRDEDGEVRYYVNGVATYAGMVQDDNGDIYYINSSKTAVKNRTYTIYEFKTNGIKAAGTYAFDANGKMIDSATLKNGIVLDDDGEIRYYVSGEATYAGMVQDDNGDIYYINSSKKAVKNCTYTIYAFKTNGIMAAGTYTFDALGKMITE